MRDVTGVDLIKLAQEAYALSRPQGLGFLHYEKGGLSEEEAQELVDYQALSTHTALSLDYVKGRAVKLHVFKRNGKLSIRDDWYDHSPAQDAELWRRVGIEPKAIEEAV